MLKKRCDEVAQEVWSLSRIKEKSRFHLEQVVSKECRKVCKSKFIDKDVKKKSQQESQEHPNLLFWKHLQYELLVFSVLSLCINHW